MLRRKPKFAPDAINIKLFGPGVIDVAKANPISAINTSVVMRTV